MNARVSGRSSRGIVDSESRVSRLRGAMRAAASDARRSGSSRWPSVACTPMANSTSEIAAITSAFFRIGPTAAPLNSAAARSLIATCT